MTTFILIIVVSTGYSAVATPVYGYVSREACEEAVKEVKASGLAKAEAFCITGLKG